MSVETRSIASRFSAAAGGYTAAADIQLLAAQGVADSLASLPAPARVLDLGCGTGILTRLVAQRYAAAAVCGVDISPAMIRRAREETGPSKRIQWQVADGAAFADSRGFDLVVSSASFHWMGPLPRLFGNMARLLRNGGHLVFSMMLDGTLGELHRLRREVAPGKAPVARLPSGDAALASLRASGFRVESHREDTVRAVYPSARDLLRRLHEQGVTGGPVSGGRGVLSAGELSLLEKRYGREFAEPGGVYATFAILYVVARIE